METRMSVWWQSAPRRFEAISHEICGLLGLSLPLFGLALTLVAALAVALGLWRIGMDLGWTNSFVIEGGLCSHWQIWFVLAICAQASASHLLRQSSRTRPYPVI